MTRLLVLSILAAVVMFAAGCRSDRTQSRNNSLWRSGYGFNNPNAERIKNGCPPVNFDGSVDRSD